MAGKDRLLRAELEAANILVRRLERENEELKKELWAAKIAIGKLKREAALWIGPPPGSEEANR